MGPETSSCDAVFHLSETIEDGQASSSDNGSLVKMPAMSKRHGFSGLTRRTKATTKKFLKLDGAPEDARSEERREGLLDDMKHDPAFNSSQLIKKKSFRPGKTADKTLGAIHSIGNAVVHPMQSARRTVTRTTANQLSKAERPFISQKSDVEFLQAHESLNRAESTSPSKQGTSEEEQESLIGGHRDKIREMEENRESLRAAWTTSRHVRRVRVVPKRQINLPDNEYCVERDDHGAFVRYNWLKWLGYVKLHRSRWFDRVLMSRGRILSTIRKTSAPNTSMTLKSFPLILIAHVIILNEW